MDAVELDDGRRYPVGVRNSFADLESVAGDGFVVCISAHHQTSVHPPSAPRIRTIHVSNNNISAIAPNFANSVSDHLIQSKPIVC